MGVAFTGMRFNFCPHADSVCHVYSGIVMHVCDDILSACEFQGYGGMGYYNPMNYWGYPPQGYPPQGYPPMPPAGYMPPYGQGYGYGNYG